MSEHEIQEINNYSSYQVWDIKSISKDALDYIKERIKSKYITKDEINEIKEDLVSIRRFVNSKFTSGTADSLIIRKYALRKYDRQINIFEHLIKNQKKNS